MKLSLLASSAVALLGTAGCHQAVPPPPVASAPTLTSSPLSPAHRSVYRLEFVLTPKDPRDSGLTPTRFTIHLAENQGAEVMIGQNVALATSGPFPNAAARQDVGLKVKAHHRDMPGSDDLLLDIDLEMSNLEGANVRKLTAHGSSVLAFGKSALITSMDDDKRHYELTVTPTKIR